MDIPSNIPSHIAIIPDGNGRWAKKQGFPRNVGHKRGSEVFREIVIFASDIGVKYISFYAFSTENWKRPKDEVNGLMNYISVFIRKYFKEFMKNNIKLVVTGRRTTISPEILSEIDKVVDKTSGNTKMTVNICLDYGGREEITDATGRIACDLRDGVISDNDITEELIQRYLYTCDLPDPDMLIRTSGEKRISNFLLWQLAYTEFIFMDVLWPDFKADDLLIAINEFNGRKRRFGGVK